MLKLPDFFPEVYARVPLASEPDIMAALRDAARVLCQTTKRWRDTRDLTVTLPSGQTLWADAESRIEMIETARMDGRPLALIAPDELDRRHPDWQDTPATTGTAQYVTQIETGEVVVWPPQSGTIRMRMTLVPARSCSELPAFLLHDHIEVLGKGAAARLYMMPNPDHANPALSAELERQFKSEVFRIATSAARHQIKAPRRSRGAYF